MTMKQQNYWFCTDMKVMRDEDKFWNISNEMGFETSAANLSVAKFK